MRNETLAIHGGYDGDPTTKAVAVPIYQTAAYEFDSAEHGAALFNLEAPGFRYSRINNPTTDVLDRRVALLEGGVGALCVASGQAALHYAVLNLTQAGHQHRLGAAALRHHPHAVRASAAELRHRRCGSPSPTIPADIAAADRRRPRAASFARASATRPAISATSRRWPRWRMPAGVPLVVDNTVATPILLRPIDYGADIVVHSLTKFMGGHGTTLGGAIVDSGKFPWKQHAARFRQFNEPDHSYHGLVYADHFGPSAYIARCRSVYQRTTGSVLSPLSAFLLLQGIETVALRVERHVENAPPRRRIPARRQARGVGQLCRLSRQPVSRAGREISRRQGLFAADLWRRRAASRAARAFYDALKLVKRLVNLGDAKSLACHPASTTHRQMPRGRADQGRRDARR